MWALGSVRLSCHPRVETHKVAYVPKSNSVGDGRQLSTKTHPIRSDGRLCIRTDGNWRLCEQCKDRCDAALANDNPCQRAETSKLSFRVITALRVVENGVPFVWRSERVYLATSTSDHPTPSSKTKVRKIHLTLLLTLYSN